MQILNSSQKTEKHKRTIKRVYILGYMNMIKLSGLRLTLHTHTHTHTQTHTHKHTYKWTKTYPKATLLGRVISANIICVCDHQGNTRNPNMLLESFKKIILVSFLRYKQTNRQKKLHTQTENLTESLKWSLYIKIYKVHLSHWPKFIGPNENQCGNQSTWLLCILQSLKLQLK